MIDSSEMTDTVTEESLVGSRMGNILSKKPNRSQTKAWKELASPTAFDNFNTHPYHPINREPHERKLYCFECKEIRFQDEKGKTIWVAHGSGEITLPPQIGVFAIGGKTRLEAGS